MLYTLGDSSPEVEKLKKAAVIAIIAVLVLSLVPFSKFASARYGGKIIDGNLNDWTQADLVAVGRDTGLAGANLDRLYVAWDDEYLYIAIKTNNTEHWNTVLGVGIDVDPGTGNGYTGADQDGNPDNGFEDIWWRDIGFGGGYAIDYELYFWYDSSNERIGGGDLKHWDGSSWQGGGLDGVKYASSPSPSFGVVEIAIPWSKLGGKPEKVAVITWLAGGDAHSSAIDTLPVDPAVDYPAVGNDEWTDKDVLTNLATLYVSPKSIDGNLSDWSSYEVVAVGRYNTLAGADLGKLYVSWDNDYLYLAITTNNTESWNVAYGFGIDVDPGSGNGYTGGSDPSDAWSRRIGFGGGYAIDYELYFWWGWDKGMDADNFITWTGSGWDYKGLADVGAKFAYTGNTSTGLKTLEIAIPWSALGGKRQNFAVISWVAGLSGSSAVDSLPVDPAINYSEIIPEWDDSDVFTNLAEENWFLMADLTTAVSGPSVVGLNRTAVYNVTVKNEGSLPADNATVLAYVNDTVVLNETVSLGPGEEKWFTFNWTPNETGTYTLKAVVDPENRVPEASEGNNEFVMNVSVVWVGKIDVDGNPDDWKISPGSPNTLEVKNGIVLWTDAVGDQRTDKDRYLPGGTSAHADLTEVGFTTDDKYAYFLFEFRNMSNIKIGDNGATFIAVPMDFKEGGAKGTAAKIAGEMDTLTPLEWDLQMAINLCSDQYKGETKAVSEAGTGKRSLLYFVDPSGNLVPVEGALVGVDLSKNTVEVRIPLGVFGSAKKLNFQVATGFSYGDGVWNFGDPFSNDDKSDAVDVLSDKDTSKEVADGYIDYYVQVELGNFITHATTVDYQEVRQLIQIQNFWKGFIAMNKYYGTTTFKRYYQEYTDLDKEIRDTGLPGNTSEELRALENRAADLLKEYNQGVSLIDNKGYAFMASLKIFRAYTGMKQVVADMEALLKKIQSGQLEREEYLKELAKNLTKNIDGNLDDWKVAPVAVDDTGFGQEGANLKALYVDYDDQFLYIALTTENKASWRVAYGISLDYKDGGYTAGQDSWGKKIDFGRGVDAQLYFFWNGEFFGDKGTSTITTAQLAIWNGTGWEYRDLQWIGFYNYTGGAQDGLQTLEIAIPWSELGGKPKQISVVAYVTGQGVGDSAVDSLPLQDAVKDKEPGQEWGDVDTFTQFATVTIR